MNDVLANLSPRSVWGHFATLAAIPRPSGHEERAVAFVSAVGESMGVVPARDTRGNVVLRIPATPGRERAATLILQGVLDRMRRKG